MIHEHRNILGLVMMLEMVRCRIQKTLSLDWYVRHVTKIVALQEAFMKDWIGQAGMLSCARFASAASCLYLYC